MLVAGEKADVVLIFVGTLPKMLKDTVLPMCVLSTYLSSWLVLGPMTNCRCVVPQL